MDDFYFDNTHIEGLVQGCLKPKGDKRGYFERVCCVKEFCNYLGRDLRIKQINRSMSSLKGTTRGLHFQWPPMAEVKIVSCPTGRLFDVALDLRMGSPTYLQHYCVELDSREKNFLIIPEGFAHGFQTLEDYTEIMYLVSQEFSIEHDDGINPTDPSVSIQWPLDISCRSPKDTHRKFLIDRDFSGINLSS